MAGFTDGLWAKQNRHPGDRESLFRAVDDELGVATVLYPGSYVDIAASFVFGNVTYVDVDKRAARFFGDRDGVDSLIASEADDPPKWRFIHADFNDDLDIEPESVDLLISLYAGFISDACAGYLRSGGHLLANTSHGDVALATLDPRYRLVGVVVKRSTGYRLLIDGLNDYIEPKSGREPTEAEIRASGRGIAYRKPASAYLFRRL